MGTEARKFSPFLRLKNIYDIAIGKEKNALRKFYCDSVEVNGIFKMNEDIT